MIKTNLLLKQPIIKFYSDKIIKIDASKLADEVYDDIYNNLDFSERLIMLEKEFKDDEDQNK